jgi:hypothetical protein
LSLGARSFRRRGAWAAIIAASPARRYESCALAGFRASRVGDDRSGALGRRAALRVGELRDAVAARRAVRRARRERVVRALGLRRVHPGRGVVPCRGDGRRARGHSVDRRVAGGRHRLQRLPRDERGRSPRPDQHRRAPARSLGRLHGRRGLAGLRLLVRAPRRDAGRGGKVRWLRAVRGRDDGRACHASSARRRSARRSRWRPTTARSASARSRSCGRSSAGRASRGGPAPSRLTRRNHGRRPASATPAAALCA